MMTVRDVLDEALTRLASTGPEFGRGLSNHGPMAAEALVALGRSDEVEPWLDGHLTRLDDTPARVTPITDDSWRIALGDPRRVTDWTEYLRRQLDAEPWQQVLARWWPRLLPGIAAGATHGVIRTAHAVRSLTSATGPARHQELARGLAYWAARYQELPGVGQLSGQLPVGAALMAVPTLPDRRGGLITDQLARLGDVEGYPAAVAAVRPAGPDVDAAIGELIREFAAGYLRRGYAAPVAFVHTVTAPTAVRSMLPVLPQYLHRPSYDALWQVGAAIQAGYAGGYPDQPAAAEEPAGPEPAADDLADRAVANGDEHAVKFTEACLREWHRGRDSTFLRAADLALTAHF